MSEQRHSISYGVVCDDIRQESNGKLILVGVYSRDIRLSKIPGQAQLAFLIALNASETGGIKFESQVLFNGEQMLHANGEGNIDGKGLAMVSFPPGPFVFKSEGELVFRARLEDEEWIELWRGSVRSVEQGKRESTV